MFLSNIIYGVRNMDMVPVMYLYFVVATFIIAIMAVIISGSGEGRILLTILAASGFFYGGFALLVSAFNVPAIALYGLAGICILGTIAYAIMNAKAIVAETSA
jgi:hypothetical protein